MENGIISNRKPNPQRKACIVSAITYLYSVPTFVAGFKRDLQESDLLEILPEATSSKVGDQLENAWFKQISSKSNGQPSLRKAIFKVFFWDILTVATLVIATELSWIGQPLLCGIFLRYFESGQKEISEQVAYGCAAGIILCSFLNLTFGHAFMFKAYNLGMKIKVACCSVVYRKTLRLTRESLSKTHGGQIVNLMSNDVDKLDMIAVDPMYAFIAPIECLVCTFLMYTVMGWSAVVGVAVMVVFIPLQVLFGTIISKYRRQAAQRTDERVKLTNEIISGIHVIKMYAWENLFSDLIEKARKIEMDSLCAKLYVKGRIESFFMFNTRLAIFGTIITYVLLGNSVTAEKIFVLYAFYNVLRPAMTVCLPESIPIMAEAKISLGRMAKFLLLDEYHKDPRSSAMLRLAVDDLGKEAMPNGKSDDSKPSISLKNVSARWGDSSSPEVLKKVTLEVASGKLVAVVGSVASGKSSLLQVILKELPASDGSVSVSGKISYSSQEPWLFGSTVRQNILFGSPMDEARYREVVRVCALDKDFDILPHADLTMVGDRGVSLSGGQRNRINLARAVYKDADIYLLDDPLSAVDAKVGKHIFENGISEYLKGKIVILNTHNLQTLRDVDHIVYLKEGVIVTEGSYQQVLESNSLELTEAEESVSKDEEFKSETGFTISSKEEKTNEPQENKTTSGSVWRDYLKAVRSPFVVLAVMLLFATSQLLASFSDYMLGTWANLEQMRRHHNTTDSSGNTTQLGMVQATPEESYTLFGLNSDRDKLILYSSVCAGIVVVTFVRSQAFYSMAKRASISLHRDMFFSVLKATVRFFDVNGAGKILNRFSNDMGIADDQLPCSIMKSTQYVLASVGIVLTIVSLDLWYLIPTAFLVVLVLLMRMIYLRTGRVVKRLERMSRSPVFGHLNASLQGLTTIRAFKAEKILISEFDSYQDLHTSAWYTYLVTTRAFGYWMDICCVLFSACIVIGFLIFDTGSYAGKVGLAITQALSLSRVFQRGVRQSTEMENQMTSVERIVQYGSIEHESDPADPSPLPATWPDLGKIEFRHVSLKYGPEDPSVLHDISFVIRPGEKIGIVGRTGAGKSSLLSALFQLAKTEGEILIDDVDVSKIKLSDLRSRLSIIPQQPILFCASLRKNLDPFGQHSDADIWKALEEVELQEYASALTGRLDFRISEGGSNFSIGQRQLVCLARTVLFRNRILVLDEATANVDRQTDEYIQKTIREKFTECTVLTIAHRLDTVADCDRVLVMDQGRVSEFDSPRALLQRKSSLFYEMAVKAGNLNDLLTLTEKAQRR